MHQLYFTQAQMTLQWPPYSVPHSMMRDRVIQVGGGRKTAPLSDAALSEDIQPILLSLLSNMERVLSLLFLPQLVFDHGRELERLAQSAAFELAGKPDVHPDLHPRIRQRYLEARGLNPGDPKFLRHLHVLPVPETQVEIDREANADGTTARAGFEAILHSAVLGTWTAFESLAVDLWLKAVDLRPRSLAINVVTQQTTGRRPSDEDAAKRQDPRIRFTDLAKWDFNVSGAMGRLLLERHRVSLDSLTGIQAAYLDAFRELGDEKKPATAVQEFFKQYFLDLKLIEATRNLLAHRGGVVDQRFLNEVGAHSSTMKKLVPGELIPIQGLFVNNCLDVVGNASMSLLNFVADWLAQHPD